MSSKTIFRGLAKLVLVAGLYLAPTAQAQNCDCDTGPCPPHFKYRFEGPPKIKFKHGCPKPICDPCNLPHFGYYQTCWQPWPFPPNWDHCPVPPPAALVQPIPPERFRQEAPMNKKDNEAPAPKPADAKPLEPMPLAEPPKPVVENKPAVESSTVADVKPKVETPPRAEIKPQPEVKPPVEEKKPLAEAKAHTPPPPVSAPTPDPMVTLPPVPTEAGVEKQAMKDPPSPYMPKPNPVPPSVLAPLPGIEDAPTIAPTSYQQPAKQEQGLVERKTGSLDGIGPRDVRMVNSRRIMLDYDTSDVPAGQHAMLELWYTQDGRNWLKDPTQIKSGAPYVVDVGKEGTYGFMLVARGPAERSTPPSPGEAPQVWVEVDWTKPAVNLISAVAAQGPMGRNVSLVWSATDNNLSEKPITLSYAENPQGPWTTFAASVENNGRFVWQVPNNVPKSVFVRVEAFDLVGNAGTVISPTAIPLP